MKFRRANLIAALPLQRWLAGTVALPMSTSAAHSDILDRGRWWRVHNVAQSTTHHRPLRERPGGNRRELVGRRLDATWREGKDDGWLTFNFTPDGKAFEGEWGYHGEKPAGKWIGKRS